MKISDRKKRLPGTTPAFEAVIETAQDYYPFGSLMPGRKYNAGEYRFGFNGQEKDDEIAGVTGSHLDFGARVYDSRLGRFLSLDPKWKVFPDESPFIFAGNNPLFYIDRDGEIRITYLVLVGENGHETKLAIVDKDYVEWSAEYHDIGMVAFDVEETYRIDLKTGKQIGDVSKKYHRRIGEDEFTWLGQKMGTFQKSLSEFEAKLQGEGGVQKGGIYEVSESGGANPTKFKSLSEAAMIDIGNLITAFGVLGGTPGEIPTGDNAFVEALNSLAGAIGEKLPEQTKTQELETVDSCVECNRWSRRSDSAIVVDPENYKKSDKQINANDHK